jgi:hypothetical protein
MNWKQRLFKPKWQHKDADVRLAAVSTEQDPQLISSLVEIADNDEDNRVRCAAIKRLHQLENILKLYSSAADPGIKTLLEKRIRQLAASSDEHRPALELRMQVIGSTTDRKLIEHLASHAPESELRRAALAKVERQGLLGDCCIGDSDSENRRYAAGLITQHTTLKRVIEGLRKRDKALYAELQARHHEELLAKADPKAVQSEALQLCIALEHVALEAGNAKLEKAEPLHIAWKGIAGMVKPDMTERYERICTRLTAPIATPPVRTKEIPEPVAKTIAKTEPEPVEVAPAASQEDVKIERELEKATLEREAELKRQVEKSAQELAGAQELLAKLSGELEKGKLHNALETRARIQGINKGQGKHHNNDVQWQQINRSLVEMLGRIRELREWHHWSNDKIRKRLIAEMEILPSADLHPDALLDRVKSLQSEWKTLEQSEQIPGEKRFAASPWMWRKFSAAGHTAFDTAKPYLEKRSEIQSRHAQSLATFCAELEQLADAVPQDWTALGKAMGRGRKKLHDLNNVPAKQRQKFARKLKAALDKGNKVIQEHYELVEKEKMKLIRSASQLLHLPERSEAIAQAKSLQSDWKAAGSLWRSKEQELWNQFREHLDPLFEELKEKQETQRAAEGEKLAAQKALCNQLREILKLDKGLSGQHGIVQGLQDSWKDVEYPDRKLRASFQAMVDDYKERVKRAEQQQVDTDRDRLWSKSSLLHELTVSGRTAKGSISKKTLASVKKAWSADTSSDALEMAMDEVCNQILSGTPVEGDSCDGEELVEKARLLCIRLEFVAGLPSPEEEQDQRMQYQVDRLAESMSGETVRQLATDEAREAEKTWLGMYALAEPEFKAFGKRVKLALKAIMES